MSARHISAVALGLTICASAIFPSRARCQEDDGDVVPQVDNAKYRFVGRVISDSPFVRSGPSRDSSYPTMKLAKGDELTVVGIKRDWLNRLTW